MKNRPKEKEYLDHYDFEELKSKLKSEGEIYYHAKKLNYKDFNEFSNGITKGLKKVEEYRDAKSKGFIHAKQYKMALKRCFKNPKEFEEAKKLDIKRKEDYDKYLEFKEIKKEHSFETIEEAHLFKILKDFKMNEKIAVSKLWETLQKEQENFIIEIGSRF